MRELTGSNSNECIWLDCMLNDDTGDVHFFVMRLTQDWERWRYSKREDAHVFIGEKVNYIVTGLERERALSVAKAHYQGKTTTYRFNEWY